MIVGRQKTLPRTVPRCICLQRYHSVKLCIFVMSVSFSLSLYTRLFIHNGFGKEDCACSIAWPLGVCYSVIALIMGHYGGGLHYSDIPIEHRTPLKKTLRGNGHVWSVSIPDQDLPLKDHNSCFQSRFAKPSFLSMSLGASCLPITSQLSS